MVKAGLQCGWFTGHETTLGTHLDSNPRLSGQRRGLDIVHRSQSLPPKLHPWTLPQQEKSSCCVASSYHDIKPGDWSH